MNFNWNQIPPMPQTFSPFNPPIDISSANPAIPNRQIQNGRQALPPLPPMPSAMPERQPWQAPPMPKPRDRRIKKGSTLQSLGWLLAALAAPKVVEGYLAGRNEGFDRADESDMREYQMLMSQGQFGANQQQQDDEARQRDQWNRYEAGIGERKLVGAENDDAADSAAALKRLEDARFKTNLGAGMDFFKSRGLAPSNEFMQWAGNPEMYPYPTLTDAPVLGSPMSKGATNVLDTIAKTTGDQRIGNELVNQGLPANAPRSAGDPFRLGGSVKKTEEATKDIIRKPIESQKDRDARAALQAERLHQQRILQTQREIAQAQRDAARFAAQAARDAAKPPKPPKAPPKLNESERDRARQQKSNVDPATWKMFDALGIAPGPQAMATFNYYKKNGLIKVAENGGISVDATHGSYNDFIAKQKMWEQGKLKWVNGREMPVVGRGPSNPVARENGRLMDNLSNRNRPARRPQTNKPRTGNSKVDAL